MHRVAIRHHPVVAKPGLDTIRWITAGWMSPQSCHNVFYKRPLLDSVRNDIRSQTSQEIIANSVADVIFQPSPIPSNKIIDMTLLLPADTGLMENAAISVLDINEQGL